MSVFDPFAAAASTAPVAAEEHAGIATIDAGPGTCASASESALGSSFTLFSLPSAVRSPSLSIVEVKHGKRYIEVGLCASGTSAQKAFAVGAVFGPTSSQKRDQMPGWQPATIGLHSDDAKIVGDVSGVGIFTTGDGMHELVFTVNGNKVYSRKLAAGAEIVDQMHFAVGLLGSGVSVDINGGEHPFRYVQANAAPGAELSFGIKSAPKGSARAAAGAGGPSADLMRLIQQLPSNSTVRRRCTSHKIGVMSVAWEDTGRTKGSCFGPNISDMTLAVGGSNMPIFRKPNYSDLTSDQDMSSFWLVVGNESAGAPKRSIQLADYLKDIGRYIGRPEQGSLLAPSRDSKVLTAAQACVLPLRDGKVEFNVRLYNYQSRSEPAVLVIVASSEGTSAQVVLGRDNLLRFNKAGGAADFVAERLSDDRVKRGVAIEGEMSADERKRNCLLIIQVPLKVERRARPGLFAMAAGCAPSALGASVKYRSSSVSTSLAAPARGIEAAMISTSDARGVYEGVRGHKLVRDTDFPIRCTLQYYHVTDTTDLSEDVVAGIAGQVNELYDAAAPWNKGSLVTRGASGRVTEHTSALGFASSIAPPPPPVVWVWGFRV